MARLYPAQFPDALADDPGRRAEKFVYEALARLDDSWAAFYSVPWHLKSGTAPPRDGEGDFVVAHPERGFAVLEVKGGGIRFDPVTGEWTSTSGAGNVYPIKDPARQALSTSRWLLEHLRRMPAWRDSGWVTAGHAVVFPDTRVGRDDLRSDLPRALVIDATDLRDPSRAIDVLFDHFEGDRPGPLGAAGMRLLTATLARPIDLKVPLALDLDREAERILHLTESQAALLDMLGSRRRALIQGCAGSGKTFLALERASRLAAEGRSVLLTCFNEPLGGHLARHAADGVTAVHFHGLCERLLSDNRLPIPPVKGNPAEYYATTLPGAVLGALDAIPTRFDALVVDEGQDFEADWLLLLEALLTEPTDEQPLFVFVDDHQDIYGRAGAAASLIADDPFVLGVNLRTTQAIHALAVRFHPEPANLRADGPEGRAPEVATYRDERGLVDSVRRLLHRLLVEEQVATRDLVILTPHAQGKTAFRHGDTLGRFTFVDHRPASEAEVQVSTMHRFKGLERPVVLLAEIDGRTRGDLDRLLYVGISRAQGHLAVLCSEALPPEILDRLTAGSRGRAPC